MNIFKKIKSFFIPKIEKTKVSIKDLKVNLKKN